MSQQSASVTEEWARRVAHLERANADLTRFTHLAAHDLQEPLNVVTGYLDLLRQFHDGRLELDAPKATRAALEAAQRMGVLIQELLDFASLGQPRAGTRRVSLEGVLAAATANLAAAIHESNAAITHTPLPFVTGDESHLTRVLQNLISNALKFRKATEPPLIRLSAERDGDDWRISVRDNGIGFDATKATLIFQPLQRLHGAGYPGTGLGLASCRAIIEADGGRIWAESAPGEGSVFHFTLHEAPPQWGVA